MLRLIQLGMVVVTTVFAVLCYSVLGKHMLAGYSHAVPHVIGLVGSAGGVSG